MHIPINLDVLNKCIGVTQEFPEAAGMIFSSIKSTQLISKYEIVRDIDSQNKSTSICILAGWCTIGFNLLFKNNYQITSVDRNINCKKVGEKIFNNVTFVTECISRYRPDSDIVINTSTEHIERDALIKSFYNITPGTTCYFQNNNMKWVDSHINCFDDLDLFCSFLKPYFSIEKANALTFLDQNFNKINFNKIRYNVKCLKI